MKEMLMSQMGFWVSFTILFMLIAMSWFIYKMVKLSKQKGVPLKEENES